MCLMAGQSLRKSHSPSNSPAITKKQAQVLTNGTTSTLVSVRSVG